MEGADGRVRRVNIISESGMYRLVLRSDKPEAEPFIEWVTRLKKKPARRNVWRVSC
ncbi:MAG: BRO family protein [bacterium]|nr:BRO family protein [bacterium]